MKIHMEMGGAGGQSPDRQGSTDEQLAEWVNRALESHPGYSFLSLTPVGAFNQFFGLTFVLLLVSEEA